MRLFSQKRFRILGHAPDGAFLFAVGFLVIGGLFALASASSDIAAIRYATPSYFLLGQILKGLLPGLVGFLIGYVVYYRRWKRFSFILFLLNIILLVLVFTPLGYAAKGSHRWIELGPLSFQPSELLKITFVLYLASLFSSTHMRSLKGSWKMALGFIALSGLVGGLIFLQPATTMAIVILTSGLIMFIFSGARMRHVAAVVGLAVVGISVLVAITPYRFDRFVPFWNETIAKPFPSLAIDDVEVDSFHVDQSRISIGAGGVTGVGFGESTSKYSVLPEPMGDSIFSVIAEEFGFVGSVVVIILYGLIFWRGTDIVKKSRDDFARLVTLGFVSIITIQTLIHIGANSGTLPFTGMPLPFVSYGGTALAISLTMVGVIANISRHTGKHSSL